MIRWKGVTFLIVVAVIIFILSLIFTDRWLEGQLEKAGSQLVGAKVEIDGFDFSPFSTQIKLKRLQVTDPKHTMRNLFETGNCEINFEFWPLLSKKVIVENFQIHDFKTNTPRQTDGSLPREEQQSRNQTSRLFQKSLQKVAENIEQGSGLPLQNMRSQVNVDSIFKILELKSPQKIDSLQKALNLSFEKWNQKLTTLEYEKDIQEIQQQIKKIDPQKIKTLKELQSTLKVLQKSKKKIEQLADSVKTTQKELQAEINQLRQSISLVKSWIEADYQQALAKARLPELSKQNMARMLFGSTLIHRLEQYLGYLQTGRFYLSKLQADKPKKQKPPRFKGQDIYFYSPNGRPDFWVKQISLSGETNDGLQLAGQLIDLISDQRFINRPTTIKISGQSGNQRAFQLDGRLNYLNKVPEETFQIKYSGFSLNNTKISDSPYWPFNIEKGIGQLQAELNLKGDTLFSKIYFVARQLSFDKPAEQKLNYAQQLIFETVQQLSSLDLKAQIQGQAGHWKINLNSNLDELLLAQFRKKLSGELQKAQARLRQEIEKRTKPHQEQFLKFVDQKQQWIDQQIQKHEKELNQLKAEYNKRQQEIKKRIDQEKKKAGKQVEKKLKSLFK